MVQGRHLGAVVAAVALVEPVRLLLQWLLLLRWGIGEALKERSDLLLLRLLLLLDGLLEGLHGSKEGSKVRKNRWNRNGEDFGVGVFVV